MPARWSANIRARQSTERLLRCKRRSSRANVRTLVGADDETLTAIQTRRRLRVLRSFTKALHIDDIAVLTMDRRVTSSATRCQRAVDVSKFDQDVLAQDGVLSGNVGNTVYAAASTHLPLVGETVVIITRTANAALGRVGALVPTGQRW